MSKDSRSSPSTAKQAIPRQATPKQADHIDAYVGSQMRARRKSMKMSQEKLAAQLGITFQQIQKYERGSNRIGAGRLFSIARVFDVPISYFFPSPPAEGAAGGFAEDAQAGFEGPARTADPETLEIVRMMSEIDDPDVRTSLHSLVSAVSRRTPRRA